MRRLSIVPLQAGYSALLPSASRYEDLRGGLPRTRRDMIGVARAVTVTWSLSHSELDAFMALYAILSTTREKFVAQLSIDEIEPSDYVCEIVPGSLQKGGFDRSRRRVSVELQVERGAAFNAADDNSMMDLFEEYGDRFGRVLELLDDLVNEPLDSYTLDNTIALAEISAREVQDLFAPVSELDTSLTSTEKAYAGFDARLAALEVLPSIDNTLGTTKESGTEIAGLQEPANDVDSSLDGTEAAYSDFDARLAAMETA